MAIKIALGLLAAFAIVGATPRAIANYPERPIRLVVVVSPGSGADILARTLAKKLSEQLNTPVIVENRPGASSIIGSQSVARANPDGYSLLFLNSPQTGAAALDPGYPLDLEREFAPVSLVGWSPYILGVSKSFPAKTMQEFVDYAKANPGKINYASGGVGSPAHLGVELLCAMAGIKLTHVPYKSQGDYNIALIKDEVQIALGTVAGYIPFVSSGQIRPFAAGGQKAPKEYPNIPTVAASYPGYDVDIWFSVVTTAGTPREVIKILNHQIRVALADPAMIADLERKGFTVESSTPEQLGVIIKRDIENWKEVVKRANLSSPSGTK
jgi:tripartite-type tricarboxylate transporter receptor subunit TctC